MKDILIPVAIVVIVVICWLGSIFTPTPAIYDKNIKIDSTSVDSTFIK